MYKTIGISLVGAVAMFAATSTAVVIGTYPLTAQAQTQDAAPAMADAKSDLPKCSATIRSQCRGYKRNVRQSGRYDKPRANTNSAENGATLPASPP